MWRVAFRAANVVAPVLAAAEVIVLFLAGMTGKAGLRNILRRLVLEADYFCRVALFGVRLSWTMARFAAGNLPFPATDLGEFCVRCMRVRLELIFVAVLTGFTADVIRSAVACRFSCCLDLAQLNGL